MSGSAGSLCARQGILAGAPCKAASISLSMGARSRHRFLRKCMCGGRLGAATVAAGKERRAAVTEQCYRQERVVDGRDPRSCAQPRLPMAFFPPSP